MIESLEGIFLFPTGFKHLNQLFAYTVYVLINRASLMPI